MKIFPGDIFVDIFFRYTNETKQKNKSSKKTREKAREKHKKHVRKREKLGKFAKINCRKLSLKAIFVIDTFLSLFFRLYQNRVDRRRQQRMKKEIAWAVL